MSKQVQATVTFLLTFDKSEFVPEDYSDEAFKDAVDDFLNSKDVDWNDFIPTDVELEVV